MKLNLTTSEQAKNKKIINAIRDSSNEISERKKAEEKKQRDFFKKEQQKITNQDNQYNVFNELLFKAATTRFPKNDKKEGC